MSQCVMVHQQSPCVCLSLHGYTVTAVMHQSNDGLYVPVTTSLHLNFYYMSNYALFVLPSPTSPVSRKKHFGLMTRTLTEQSHFTWQGSLPIKRRGRRKEDAAVDLLAGLKQINELFCTV